MHNFAFTALAGEDGSEGAFDSCVAGPGDGELFGDICDRHGGRAAHLCSLHKAPLARIEEAIAKDKDGGAHSEAQPKPWPRNTEVYGDGIGLSGCEWDARRSAIRPRDEEAPVGCEDYHHRVQEEERVDDAPDAIREQSCVFNLFDEVDDGDCVKEQVGDNGCEELGVFKKDIQSREEECKSGDQQRLHDDQNWQQEDFGRWQAEPVVDERIACVENNEQWDGHDAEGQEEMPEVGKRRCDWQQLPREVDLADQRHLFGDAVCSIQDACEKVGPREERGEHVDAVVWDFDRDDVLEDE